MAIIYLALKSCIILFLIFTSRSTSWNLFRSFFVVDSYFIKFFHLFTYFQLPCLLLAISLSSRCYLILLQQRTKKLNSPEHCFWRNCHFLMILNTSRPIVWKWNLTYNLNNNFYYLSQDFVTIYYRTFKLLGSYFSFLTVHSWTEV